VHGWEIPEDDLLTLARDRSVNVRYWLANLPGATREVYQILAQDADEMVATTAGLWLLPPDDPRYPGNHGGQIQSDLAEFLGADLFVQGDFSDSRYLGRPIPHVAPGACDELARLVVEMSAQTDRVAGGSHSRRPAAGTDEGAAVTAREARSGSRDAHATGKSRLAPPG
jgi:hypothetical protein